MKTTGLYLNSEFLSQQSKKETILFLQMLRIARSLRFWIRLQTTLPKEENSVFHIHKRLELLFVLISIYKESIKEFSNYLVSNLLAMDLSKDLKCRISDYNRWLSTWVEDKFLVVVDKIRNCLCFHLDRKIYEKYINEGITSNDLLIGIADRDPYTEFLFIEPSTIELNFIADIVPDTVNQDKIDWIWDRTVEEISRFMNFIDDIIKEIFKGNAYKKDI